MTPEELSDDVEFYLSRISYYDNLPKEGMVKGYGEIDFDMTQEGVKKMRQHWKEGLIAYIKKHCKNKEKNKEKDKE